MSCHAPVAAVKSNTGGEIILVGNHNVGKSVLFGWLTGKYVTVANYPGTTVEITRGAAQLDGHRQVVDTPGVSSLQPISDDERVTRDLLLDSQPHVVVQVADAKNLRRALLITSQLAELRVPLVLVLNMMDEARAREIEVDGAALAAQLGVRVILATATKREGLSELAAALEEPSAAHPLVRFSESIEQAIAEIQARLAESNDARVCHRNNGETASGIASSHGANSAPTLLAMTTRRYLCDRVLAERGRALAIMFLSGDETLDARLAAEVGPEVFDALRGIRVRVAEQVEGPLAEVMQQTRADWIDETVRQVYTARRGLNGRANGQATHAATAESFASRLGRWSVHPVWGAPILLAVLFLTYQFVGQFGAGTLVGFIEETLFGEWLNPWVTELVRAWIPFELVQDLLVGEYGIVTVALTYGFAIVLPIVFTFFIAFGILEDSGYLPRLAVMAHRVFRAMGLNGKAVLPMVLGLGCDTMATMTTRTLETKKDRVLVTLLLALGVPCSAQLGVVLGMLAGLGGTATLVWLGVVTGVLLAVGWLAARVIPGTTSDFILELPPMRVPQVSHLLIKTMARIEWYLKEVLPLFVLGTLVLFVLDRTGALAALTEAARPLITGWLGLPAQATESFLVGFLRRDYGAAGFFMMAQDGLLTPAQALVALVTITLFVPCIANFFVMVKERGLNTALAITAFVVPFAFAVGGVLNWALKVVGG